MQDELTLEMLPGAATVRLVDSSWAGYLQRLCTRLKAAGERHRGEGVYALVNRLRLTRPSTHLHSVRTARYSRLIGRALGFDDVRLKQLASTAMMHDIGKLVVPESILSRPRRPTRVEQFILHLHPSFGALLASYFDLPAELRIRTQHHHERWDGKGYPHRLGGYDIPLMARVVQVADTYDAMVERRPYNTPRTHDEAAAELRREAGRQFDPRLVEAFLDSSPARSILQ
jgi:HD-GYP domain-containing protein (c-di-GMP phosphodiesterase class II)